MVTQVPGQGINSPSGIPKCQCKPIKAAHFDTFHNALHDFCIRSK